jgi:hypothetical protein
MAMHMADRSEIEAFRLKIRDAELAKLDGEPDSRLVRIMRTLLRERRVWVDGARMRTVHRLCEHFDGIEGAFVECGVAMGASLSLLAAYAGPDRLVWGFDSFEALPDLVDKDEGQGEAYVGLNCSGDEGEQSVRRTFELVDVPMTNVRIVKGWFEDRLPALCSEVGPIAILRLDADWYQSTRDCLDTLYESVVSRGAVIIDDYFSFKGCRTAVDEFREIHRVDAELRMTDSHSEVYWFKS